MQTSSCVCVISAVSKEMQCQNLKYLLETVCQGPVQIKSFCYADSSSDSHPHLTRFVLEEHDFEYAFVEKQPGIQLLTC